MPLPNVSTNIGNVSMDYFLRGVDAAKAQGVQAQGQANVNDSAQMSELKDKVEIAKSDGTNVTVGNKIGFVGNYCVVDCPSYYKRDYLDKMFK